MIEFDHRRADHCDCEEQRALAPGWTCGKPECHRTKIVKAVLNAVERKLKVIQLETEARAKSLFYDKQEQERRR